MHGKKIDLMFRVIYNTATYKEDNTNNINKLEEYIKMGKDIGFGIRHDSFVLQSCEAVTDSRAFYLLPNLILCLINKLYYRYRHTSLYCTWLYFFLWIFKHDSCLVLLSQ